MRLQLKEPQKLLTGPAPRKLTRTAEMIAEELLIKWEGLRLEAYKDAVGIPTIGYGTIRIDGQPVKMGMRITEEQALKYKRADMQWAVETVKEIETTLPRPLEPHEAGALISWTYNVGAGAARSSKAVTGRMKAGDFEGAANGLLKWNKGGDPLRAIQGLTNRREDERAVFLGRDLPPQFEEPTVESSEAGVGAEPTPVEDVKPHSRSTSLWAVAFSMLVMIWEGLQEVVFVTLGTADQILRDGTLIKYVTGPALIIIAIFAMAWVFKERWERANRGE